MPGILILPGNIQTYSPQTGQTPYTQTYQGQEVPVGNARFWLIGKDTGGTVVPGGIYLYQIDLGGTSESGTVVVAR